MNAPPILQTRRKLIARLKDDPTVTAILPAASILGERTPSDLAWPFSRIGEMEGEPNGDVIRGNFHVFSKAEITDEVHGILAAMGTSIDSASIDLDSDDAIARIRIGTVRVIPDGSVQGAWHGILPFIAEVARDCDEA